MQEKLGTKLGAKKLLNFQTEYFFIIHVNELYIP